MNNPDNTFDWIADRYGHWWDTREVHPDETPQERSAAQYWRTVAEAADCEPPASFYADTTGPDNRLERQYDNTQAAMLNDHLWDGDTS